MHQWITRTRVSSAVLVTLLLGAAPAAAQDAELSMDDILVTAKNRTERLQDVPLSISAFDTADLRDAQIRDIRDLQKITPNISLFGGGGRNDPTAYAVRGLTSNTSDERYQGVSFFLDGIALSGQLASIDIDNVERVEVIKGPQSATFGRATYSGAVNFVTKEPKGDSVSGFVRARGSLNHGSTEDNYYLGGSLTLPIAKDQLWLSVAGTVLQNGAVARATDTGAAVGRERSQTGTATLFWKPDDSFSIRLRGLYTHDRDQVPAQVAEHPRDWLQAGVAVHTAARASGSFLPDNLPDPDVDTVASKGATGTNRDRYFGSAIVSKMIGGYELSYRGGYFYNKDYRHLPSIARAIGAGQDPVFGALVGTSAVAITAIGRSTSISAEVFENTSHQLVLVSPSDKALRWRVGGYYFWEADTTSLPLSASTLNPTGRANTQRLTNYAGFGGFDWDLVGGLTLSGEARVAREELTYKACPACINPIAADTKRSTSDFSPRVTLSYKASPDNLLYGLYSRGVKSGRFSYANVNGVPTILFAEPEKLDNFEIGSKNTFADGRITINASGFYDKVRNQQLVSTVSYILPSGTTYSITSANNVGKSEIWGFELETSARITPRFTLRGSAGYAHQEFVNKNPVLLQATSVVTFPGAVGSAVVLDGKSQANVPRWNGYAAAEYTVPKFVQDYDLMLRFDGSYRGAYFVDLGNTVSTRGAWTLNTRVSLSNDRWDVALFGRNLLNNQRAVGSGLAGATSSCGFTESNTAVYGGNQQCLSASPPRPAEAGLEAVLRF